MAVLRNQIDLPEKGFPSRGRTTFAYTILGVIVWLTIIAGATVLINDHTNVPGPTGTVQPHWPAQTTIPRSSQLPTLVMFIHPRCPCTRASLGELERLMANCPGQCNVRLMFLQPAGAGEDWTKTALWRKASAIPGATVLCDPEGVEARRFHAGTSGQTMLYDRDGRLLFDGGITVSRGHSGDNPGSSAIESLLRQDISHQASTPVFGCSLFGEPCEGDTTCKL